MKSLGVKAALIISITLPIAASGQAVINEIMYDPEGSDSSHGGEWVELLAEGNMVDFDSWKVADQSGTKGKFLNRSVSHVSGPKNITTGSYLVVSENPEVFKKAYPAYSGSLFQSNLSLTEEDEIKILDPNSKIVDAASYIKELGAKGDGASLQRIDGSWMASVPTPGSANSLSEPKQARGPTYSPSLSWAQSATSGSIAPVTSSINSKLEVAHGGDRLTSPGSPISFQAVVKKNAVPDSKANFSWSFGDGFVGAGQFVTHIYKYPGEYIVVLNAKAGDAVATSRSKVRVVAPEISISVGEGYLELLNNSNAEINLFNWKIVHAGKAFIFQPDTIILPKSSIKVDLSLFTMRGEREGETSLTNFLGQKVVSFINMLRGLP